MCLYRLVASIYDDIRHEAVINAIRSLDKEYEK
jgi:hypothetical protein